MRARPRRGAVPLPGSDGGSIERAWRRRRRSLARSVAHTWCGVGDGGGGGGRLHRTSRASRAPCVTRAHAHIITASRASSPFNAPPAHDRHACAAAAAALACSLARSIARTRCGVGGGGGVQLHLASRVSRAPRVTRAHVRASAPVSVPPAHNRRARAAAAAAFARSLDRAHAVLRWQWRSRSVTPRVTHVTCAARHARACARHHRFPFPLRTTGTRALRRRRRSLDRLIARSRARGVA